MSEETNLGGGTEVGKYRKKVLHAIGGRGDGPKDILEALSKRASKRSCMLLEVGGMALRTF